MFGMVNLIILLILIVGGILLQFHLSKSDSKWPGLVLPIIAFVFSFLPPLNMMIFSEFLDSNPLLEIIIPIIFAFLLCNIPTLILMAIYFSNRSKANKLSEIEKMNIQDLN